jgi:aquaporin Z
MECWALGCFMITISLLLMIFESPKSPVYTLIPAGSLRATLLAAAVGFVLTLIIESPWGKRSGAHMNPAITLAFFRLKKVHPWDALFYVIAQIVRSSCIRRISDVSTAAISVIRNKRRGTRASRGSI